MFNRGNLWYFKQDFTARTKLERGFTEEQKERMTPCMQRYAKHHILIRHGIDKLQQQVICLSTLKAKMLPDATISANKNMFASYTAIHSTNEISLWVKSSSIMSQKQSNR